MSHNFHNTVDYKGEELEKADKKAKKQAEAILDFFHSKPFKHMTPSFVYNALLASGEIDEKVPITSIRRAMSNLTRDHELRKSENKIKGPLGVSEHEWVYEPDDVSQ